MPMSKMAFEYLGDGRQPTRYNRQWAFNGCGDGLQRGGCVAMAARMAIVTVTAAATTATTAMTEAATAEEAMTAAGWQQS